MSKTVYIHVYICTYVYMCIDNGFVCRYEYIYMRRVNYDAYIRYA